MGTTKGAMNRFCCYLVVIVLAGSGALAWFSERGAWADFQDLVCPPGGTALTWENFARPMLEARCSPCHDWRSYRSVYQSRELIYNLIDLGIMPQNEALPQADRDRLGEWMACGLPFDGPVCPSGGTALSYENYAVDFFANHCGGCHSMALEGEERKGAPVGLDWDDYPAVMKNAKGIEVDLIKELMPPVEWIDPREVDNLLEWFACGGPESSKDVPYRRGDISEDAQVDLSDAIDLLQHLFQGKEAPRCLDAADFDGSGELDITDAIFLLQYLYVGGQAPPPPFDFCGGALSLGCARFVSCP